MNQPTAKLPTIYVDADACPVAVKDILFRTAIRLEIETIFVANGTVRIPKSPFIKSIAVPHGANLADDRIVELMSAGDLVITNDVPLAARVVSKGGSAIGTRGERFDDDTVHARLATRDLMESFRSAGIDTRGPKPQSGKDIQAFANLLDRTVTRMLKQAQR